MQRNPYRQSESVVIVSRTKEAMPLWMIIMIGVPIVFFVLCAACAGMVK